jgi:ketosteroid isomerase-like protein
MMTPADTVRELYAAYARRDIAFVLARLSPDIIWEGWADNSAQRGGIAWMAERRGQAAVAEFFALTAEFNYEVFEVGAILEGAGDDGLPLVAACVRIVATPPGCARIEDETMQLFTFDVAGLVTGFRQYSDTAKLLAATGCVVDHLSRPG